MSIIFAKRSKGGKERASSFSGKRPPRAAGTAALLAQLPQLLVRPDAVVVAVGPIRLQRVVADRRDADELERSRRVLRLRPHRHAAEEIGLARAAGARTRAPQRFERIV